MLRVLIVSQYSLPEWKRNMNAYQRVFYGGAHADIHLVVRRDSRISDEILARSSVHWAPFNNRWVFLLYVFIYAAWYRLRHGLDYVITEPSGFAILGFALKYTTGINWALDVWDRPRWRPGEHEHPPTKWSDRLVFRLMKHADVFILSVLPRAARDIEPPEDRSLQFANALDMSVVSAQIPERDPDIGTLRLAYGRSHFHSNMGLQVLVEAVEQASTMGADLQIHLVGRLTSEGERLLNRSDARDRFVIHGMTEASRTALFRTIHVGLVPYENYEDLSYIFPIKVLEHLSQGNPVIASNLPGLAVMIKHGHNGMLVEPDSPLSLADAMTTLWRDYDYWKRLAENALTSVLRFDANEKNRLIFDRLKNSSS